MKNNLLFSQATAIGKRLAMVLTVLFTLSVGSMLGADTWVRVTSTADILSGGTFIIGYEATANSGNIVPMRTNGANATTSANGYLYSGTGTGTTTNSNTINMASPGTTTNYEVTITAYNSSQVELKMADGKYISFTGTSNNNLKLATSSSTSTRFTITMGTNNVVTLASANSSYTARGLRYNSSSPRFSNYSKTSQQGLVFYKKAAATPSYKVTATSNNNSYGTVSVNGTTITAKPADCYQVVSGTGGYTIISGTATVTHEGNSNTLTVNASTDCNIQVNFEKKPVNTYIDNVQDYEEQELCGNHSAPSLTDKDPATKGTCEELHWHFMGWVTEANKENPTNDNIVKANTSVTANGTTYYAVWAIGTTTGGGSTSKQYSFDITPSNFNSTSYAANNNEKTSTAKASDGSTLSVKWTSNQVMNQSSTIQWQSSKGYIYNSTDLGTITDITINSSAGTFTKYINSTKQPTSNGTGGYFQIKVGSATGKTSKVTITFTKTTPGAQTTTYSDYTTQCTTETSPSLNASVNNLAFGNVTVNQSSTKTFTFSGSDLKADAKLALSGTNAGMFSVSPTPVTPSNGSITNQTITVTYTPTAKASHSATLTISSTDAENVTISLSGTGVAQTANYTVNHYQQNITDDNYTLKETENPSGEVGESVTPDVKIYTGFKAPSTQTVTIKADGKTVVEYYYTRNSYTLTWDLDGGTITTAGTPEGAVKYGASLTAPVVVKDGFNFKGWDPTPSKMPAADATYTAQWKETYTVTLLNHGENYGENIIVEAGNPVALPTTKPTSCDTENYPNFFGWTETPIAGVDKKAPTDLITADFTPERSMILHAVFVDQLPQAGGWQMVTSASELVAGKIYTIGSYGSPDSGVAMGTQNNNNRGTANWRTGTPVELTLGGSTGAWTLYDPVEEGYLYAASNSSNHLKTQSTLTNNGRWAITFKNEKANIVAQGDNSRNIIRYNSGSSIFSCYADGQSDIYLLTKAIGTQPTAFITSCCETEAPTDGFIDGVKGSGNAMSVTLYWKDANDYKRYHVVCDELGIDEDVKNTNFQTEEVLSECTTYIFKVSSAPDGGCESPVLEIEATPFIPKTIAFVDGDNTTEQSTTCDSQSITVPTPTAQNCSTYVWKDEATDTEYDAGQTITPANDMTIVAKWSVETYTITFNDWDGTQLQQSIVECGQTPAYNGETPTRPEDNTYKYTFAGWDPSIEEANGNQTYTATYDKEAHPITVIWMVNGEEYTLGAPSTMVSAGEKVAKLPTLPDPDDYCGQVFAGWTDQPINGAPIADAPAVLFNTPEASPTLYKEGDKTTATFYAVFADIKE